MSNAPQESSLDSENKHNKMPPSNHIVISDDDKRDPSTLQYVIQDLIPDSNVEIVNNSYDVRTSTLQNWPTKRDLVIQDIQLPDNKGVRSINIYGGFEQAITSIISGLPHNNIIVSAGDIPQLFRDFMQNGAFSNLVAKLAKDNRTFQWVRGEVIDDEYVKRKVLEAMNDGRILGLFPKDKFNDIDGLLPVVLNMYVTGDSSELSMEKRFDQINLNLLKPTKKDLEA